MPNFFFDEATRRRVEPSHSRDARQAAGAQTGEQRQMKRMTHLEGHSVRDLERVFLSVVEPPYDNDLDHLPAQDAYVKALQAEQRRKDWLLGAKVATVAIGSAIIVIAGIILLAELF